MFSSMPKNLKESLALIIPSLQGILAFHDTSLAIGGFKEGVITGFSVEYSVIYLAMLAIFELFICSYYIKKLDLM
jgi:hypothetical protein